MGRSRWRRTQVRQDAGDWQETAPAFRTAELLVVIVVALGLLATAARDHALSAFQLWTLLTALAIGYLLSRGLARSGVPWRRDRTTTDYQPPVVERRTAGEAGDEDGEARRETPEGGSPPEVRARRAAGVEGSPRCRAWLC